MLFRNLRRESPTFRRAFWYAWYRVIAATVRSRDWTIRTAGQLEPTRVRPRPSALSGRAGAIAPRIRADP